MPKDPSPFAHMSSRNKVIVGIELLAMATIIVAIVFVLRNCFTRNSPF